jgi:DNA-binding IclR family transcriptional regulator
MMGAARESIWMNEDFVPVKSAIRALEIINLLTKYAHGLSFVEVQERMQWPRSSVFNLLRTMVEAGHLEFDEQDRHYRIGIRLWEAGQAYTRARDLARIARPYLEAARLALNETVQLAVLEGMENVYIAKVDSDHHLKLVSEIGSRLPAYATGLGKALLAGLDPEELAQRLARLELTAFTSRTVTDKQKLTAELRRIMVDGYAIDRGEFTVGVFCLAVAIRDASGHVVGAMSSSVPEVRVTDKLRAAMQEVLTDQAARLSKELGYRGQAPG